MTTASCTMDTPIGSIRLTASDRGLTRILLPRSGAAEESLPTETVGDPSEAAQRILREATRQLAEYFEGGRELFDVRLDLEGTPFQITVWQALLDVPFGTTVSYGEIASRISRPRAVRAVGAANGANPIPIIVPCHRVIGSDGRLTGYGGGLETKSQLLSHEGLALDKDRVGASDRRQGKLC